VTKATLFNKVLLYKTRDTHVAKVSIIQVHLPICLLGICFFLFCATLSAMVSLHVLKIIIKCSFTSKKGYCIKKKQSVREDAVGQIFLYALVLALFTGLTSAKLS